MSPYGSVQVRVIELWSCLSSRVMDLSEEGQWRWRAMGRRCRARRWISVGGVQSRIRVGVFVGFLAHDYRGGHGGGGVAR
jgi:hypothetical protein